MRAAGKTLAAGPDSAAADSAGAQLAGNLLRILAGKNLALTRKIHCTAPRGIRSRVLTYLSFLAVEHGSTSFDIPFNRQQMADYLCVDRSAMVRELKRMIDEGMIEIERRNVKLIRLPAEK